jgi:phenylpyruvate tautomerase PptA (4-oxalocrotonate tautomerase family)
MPYLKIETNKRLDEAAAQALLKKASACLAALLGKPEKWIMVSVCPGTAMLFDGSSELSAYVELKSISLTQEACADLSKSLCEFLYAELGIPPERVYIEFWNINAKMFGWNRGTF